MTAKSNKGKRKPATKNPVRLPKIEMQLQRLSAYYEAIKDRPTPSSSTPPEHLVDQWEMLEGSDPSIQASGSFILRGRTFDGRPPLAELFSYVEAGFYPPPELLLTLLDVWRDYRAADGDMELENAFLGPPVPKAGNYAARAMKAMKDIGARIRLGSEMDKGMTKADAALMLAEEFHGSDESIRKLKPFRAPDLEPEK